MKKNNNMNNYVKDENTYVPKDFDWSTVHFDEFSDEPDEIDEEVTYFYDRLDVIINSLNDLKSKLSYLPKDIDSAINAPKKRELIDEVVTKLLNEWN